MLHKRASSLPSFIASDGCQLSEVIHPNNDSTSPGFSLARASLAPAKPRANRHRGPTLAASAKT